jgi:predicted HicB family RNase H-like nuclease
VLTYRGYTGSFDLDGETGLFQGEVLNIRDVITFQGISLEDLGQAFRDSVDDYLEFCCGPRKPGAA